MGATPSGRKIGYAPTPAFSLSASLQGPPRRFTREQPLRLSRGPGLGDWGGGAAAESGNAGKASTSTEQHPLIHRMGVLSQGPHPSGHRGSPPPDSSLIPWP